MIWKKSLIKRKVEVQLEEEVWSFKKGLYEAIIYHKTAMKYAKEYVVTIHYHLFGDQRTLTRVPLGMQDGKDNIFASLPEAQKFCEKYIQDEIKEHEEVK